MGPLLLTLLSIPAADAQVWVAPRRPGQSIVRYGDLDWHTVELLAGEEIDGQPAGGVRLFFYERERDAAERAAAHLRHTYLELCDRFDFVPQERFDYVVYGTYTEFLGTNLFPVQEGVLGVTATRGLEVALPYFGDHEMFWHTSTHELAHEFTIQKARAAIGKADVSGDPLAVLPLWFVEGLAEFVALGPISGENQMRVRDLVTDPDLYAGHGLLGFWDDYPGYTLWTYAGGHARITFLEETYGEGTAQRLIELSPTVVSSTGLAIRIDRFSRLVQEVTGDDEDTVAAKFDAWIKRLSFAEYLEADMVLADVDPLDQVVGIPLALDARPDGRLLAYRTISPDSGRTSIQAVDPRRPQSTKRIVADRRLGVESLHPIDPRNFDLDDGRIAYVAESRGRDVLVVQALRHSAEEREGPSPEAVRAGQPSFDDVLRDASDTWWRVRIKKGKKQRFRLDLAGVASMTSVALEPGGERVAVVGLSREGDRDLWLVTPTADGFDARKLTDDVAAERDVSWGPGGIVYNSDASPDGEWQLFRLDPDAPGPPERLTIGGRDAIGPVVLPSGAVVYTAYEGDSAQLYLHEDGVDLRLTDLPAGAFDPQPGPDGGLWAMVLHAGRLRPSLLHEGAMTRSELDLGAAPMGPPVQLPTLSVDDAEPYRPLAPRNWSIDGGFAAVGAGVGGVFGQLYLSASDRLRDRALVVIAAAYGAPDLTDAQLLYLDQHARMTWGGGPFHGLRFRIDRSLDDPDEVLFQSGERFYGALGSLRHPLDRFVYVQLDQAFGGVSYFLFDGDERYLRDLGLLDEWERINTFPRWQSETTGRIGIDTTRFHPDTGPVAGSAVLLEATVGIQPAHGEEYGALRLDAQQFVPLPLLDGGNVSFRASAATSGLGTYARGYWLSSYDTLRAVSWGDPRLLGRHYWFTNAELQLPLDAILRFALASSIEGVAGIDFGGVSNDLDELWDSRILDGALGANVIIGSLVLRLHWARAIDIGAPLPETPSPWVTNFSISWLNL